MEKPSLQAMIIGIILLSVMMLAILYGFGFFFHDEALSTLISAYILIVLIISTPILFYLGRMKSEKTKMSNLPLEKHKRRIEVGVSLGVLIDNGIRILAKSDTCSFNNLYLKRLLEYNAVFYMQGKLDQIYGPFPADNQKINRNIGDSTSPLPEINYISYGFKLPSRTTHKYTDSFAIILISYPTNFESHIINRKQIFSSYFEKLKIRFVDLKHLESNFKTIQNEIHLLSLM
ncbi:MAG: hypothetical protein ACW964_02335 [Candidatus Hodarchaeales archaeon]